MRLFARSSVVLLLVLAGGVAPASDTLRRVSFAGWVELDADGTLVAYEPSPDVRVPAVLVEPLKSQVAGLEFLPARRDGLARPARSWLTGRLLMIPAGDTYILAIEDAGLGPKPVRWGRLQGPRPPRNGVTMLVDFIVGADGRASGIVVHTRGQRMPSAETAAEAMVAAAVFEPEVVDGTPVATPMRLPVQLRRESDPVPLPTVEATPLAAGRPGVVDQDGSAEPMLVTYPRRRPGSARFQPP